MTKRRCVRVIAFLAMLDLTQAYTIHTFTLLAHTITLNTYTLQVFTALSVQRMFHCLTEDGHFCPKIFSINHFVCLLWKSWKRGREPVHCLYTQQLQDVLQPPVGLKNTFLTKTIVAEKRSEKMQLACLKQYTQRTEFLNFV